MIMLTAAGLLIIVALLILFAKISKNSFDSLIEEGENCQHKHIENNNSDPEMVQKTK
jgi:hypothetical protein